MNKIVIIKIFKIIKHQIVAVIAFFLFAFLKVIERKKTIVFCRITNNRIGHMAANTELLLRRLKAGYFSKNEIFIGVAEIKSANRQLMNMYKRVFPISRYNWFWTSSAFARFMNSVWVFTMKSAKTFLL